MIAPEVASREEPAPIIGGFFERHAPEGEAGGRSVLDAWTEARPWSAFVNARSAFAAVAAAHPRATIWLPAFLCAAAAPPALASRTRFYPVRDGFEPDLAPVQAGARAGDLVLVTTAFGLPVSPDTQAFIARRGDLKIIEDRAQALDAGPGIGADWQLYSPRKLLGVADGGLLVAKDAATTLPRPAAPALACGFWAAPLLRQADPLGLRHGEWHAANQAKEAAMTVTGQGMTELSLAILARTPLEALAETRMRNWRALDWRLRPWSALPAAPQAPPLGYVLRLAPDTRDRVLAALHAQRIFAAVHWPQIAGTAVDFPRETQWTRELITLPCDHRYGAADMARIAALVVSLLR